MTLVILKNRQDFLHLTHKGVHWHAKGFGLQIAPNDSGGMRVGFTVSKRVDNRAVVRNRAKRRLRSLVTDMLPAHGTQGFDYVLVGKKETATRDFEDLQKDLIWALKKAHAKLVETQSKNISKSS